MNLSNKMLIIFTYFINLMIILIKLFRKIICRAHYRVLIICFILINALITFLILTNLKFSETPNKQIINDYMISHSLHKYMVMSIEYPNEITVINTFSNEVIEFMDLTQENGINLFLTEPQILISLLKRDERNLLDSHFLLPELNPKTYSSNKTQLLSFGIFAEENQKFDENFMKVVETSFTATIIRGKVGNENSYGRTSSSLLPLHYFFAKNNCIIQVIVFYKINHFLWIGSVPDSQIRKHFDHIFYGRFESAFDSFSLTKQEINNVWTQVPNELMHFISQLNSSQFIECDRETADWIIKTYPSYATPSLDADQRTIEAIIRMKSLMKQLVLPFWIGSGTLLGWYRQCGVIPYIGDTDFVTWAIYASNELNSKLMNNKVGLDVSDRYGVPDNGLQLSFYTLEHGSRVDLFFIYDENNHYTYTAHDTDKNIYFRYVYPYFRLCSAQLLGYKISTPCNAEELVRAEYGPNWKVPKSRWSYESSAFNAQKPYYYTQEEIQLNIMHQHF